MRRVRRPDIKEILELLSYIPLTPADREKKQRLVGPCRLRAVELNGGPFASWQDEITSVAKIIDPYTVMSLRELRDWGRCVATALKPSLAKARWTGG
jgi:hypothetical protein